MGGFAQILKDNKCHNEGRAVVGVVVAQKIRNGDQLQITHSGREAGFHGLERTEVPSSRIFVYPEEQQQDLCSVEKP